MNISGHRISTTEVESALVSHPSVAEAAVVDGPDYGPGDLLASSCVPATSLRRAWR